MFLCPNCGRETEGLNRNNRYYRCTNCFARLTTADQINEESDDESEELSLMELEGMTLARAGELASAGFETVPALAVAEIADLIQVFGIGSRTAEKLIEAAKELV